MTLTFTLFAVATPISVFSAELPDLPQPGELHQEIVRDGTYGSRNITIVDYIGVFRIAYNEPSRAATIDRLEVIVHGDAIELHSTPLVLYDNGIRSSEHVREIFADGERLTLLVDQSLGNLVEFFVPLRSVVGTEDTSVYTIPFRADGTLETPNGAYLFLADSSVGSPNRSARIGTGSVLSVFHLQLTGDFRVPSVRRELMNGGTIPIARPAADTAPLDTPEQPPVKPESNPTTNPGLGALPLTSPQPTVILTVGNTEFTVNGMSRQSEAPPFVAAGNRTMVPLRFIAEALGVEVGWISETRTATVNGNGISLSLPLDVPLPNDMGTPVLVGSRTFVPLRFIAEALGANIEWCGDTQRIAITGGYV